MFLFGLWLLSLAPGLGIAVLVGRRGKRLGRPPRTGPGPSLRPGGLGLRPGGLGLTGFLGIAGFLALPALALLSGIVSLFL
ncbi:hypothetical protein HUT16_35440 [Kitasatospora sp. NA04385]|uniref:hypothetical protein n=1 Tax=Kitasatospora sp. NA04385 TaxID=2742135 RepID=UPI00159209C0|nr:hypothetical protein [Kitasatospora sp. NA04385]QKW23694.1 hypothetical protein HUT16_35440 [Kitasatospora sp. NA04385]